MAPKKGGPRHPDSPTTHHSEIGRDTIFDVMGWMFYSGLTLGRAAEHSPSTRQFLLPYVRDPRWLLAWLEEMDEGDYELPADWLGYYYAVSGNSVHRELPDLPVDLDDFEWDPIHDTGHVPGYVDTETKLNAIRCAAISVNNRGPSHVVCRCAVVYKGIMAAAHGISLTRACSLMGVDRTTFHSWEKLANDGREPYIQLWAAFQLATSMFVQHIHGRTAFNSHDRNTAGAVKLLQLRFRNEYAERQEVDQRTEVSTFLAAMSEEELDVHIAAAQAD